MSAWEGIEEAVAIADAGSFAGAAKLLLVSTSHVSKVIARLERRLEAPLFHRTTRRVELTDGGRTFVEQGRRILQERDEMLLTMTGSAEPQGELRVTCSIALGERFVAPIVRRFCEAHPRLGVSLDLTNRLVDLIGEGYDVAIRTGDLADPRLLGLPIADRPIETCAAPAYLAARGEPATVAELAGHDCLIGSRPLWYFRQGDAVRAFTPKGRWRCNSGAVIAEAAAAGMGICQLPLSYLQAYKADGRLVPVLGGVQPPPELVQTVYPARRHLTPKIRNLVSLLESDLQPAIDIALGL
jgi:DNA-binding transcriptional LysR family regulator